MLRLMSWPRLPSRAGLTRSGEGRTTNGCSSLSAKGHSDCLGNLRDCVLDGRCRVGNLSKMHGEVLPRYVAIGRARSCPITLLGRARALRQASSLIFKLRHYREMARLARRAEFCYAARSITADRIGRRANTDWGARAASPRQGGSLAFRAVRKLAMVAPALWSWCDPPFDSNTRF